ncbi:MAG TPA: LuxR C-terminal-related transcriptional regulator [Draconibacterium sp.]|nr:LuxR C-terminal-related transcriptional regulator [Draconibacterium sp.]
MVQHSGISKVMDVWESRNKILNPVKKEIYLDIIDQMAGLFAAGSFYYYILDFENLEMDLVHNGTKSILGIDPGRFSLKKLLEIVHPEDIEKLHEKESAVAEFLFNRIPKEQIPFYKVVYLLRLRHTDGTYKTILHQSKTLVLSEGGKIQKVLGIHTDVSYLNMTVDHKISFVSDKFPSYHSLQVGEEFELVENSCGKLFTQRELEIIKMLAHGKNFNEIAEILHLSPHTINTHKKNILRKSNFKNTTELVARCIREGAI